MYIVIILILFIVLLFILNSSPNNILYLFIYKKIYSVDPESVKLKHQVSTNTTTFLIGNKLAVYLHKSGLLVIGDSSRPLDEWDGVFENSTKNTYRLIMEYKQYKYVRSTLSK